MYMYIPSKTAQMTDININININRNVRHTSSHTQVHHRQGDAHSLERYRTRMWGMKHSEIVFKYAVTSVRRTTTGR